MAQEYLPAPSNVRLADLMKEHNISQPELAKEIGCSKSTINRFISGAKGTLTHEQVLKIARLFNVSTDFLLVRARGGPGRAVSNSAAVRGAAAFHKAFMISSSASGRRLIFGMVPPFYVRLCPPTMTVRASYCRAEVSPL